MGHGTVLHSALAVGWPPISLREEFGPTFQAQELVLFPIHSPAEEPHGDWSLIVAWPKTYVSKVFDSLGNPCLPGVGCVRAFVLAIGQEVGGTTVTVDWKLEQVAEDTPWQTDDVSSGIFLCVFAERISRRRPVRGRPFDGRTARKVVTATLRRGRFDHEDFVAAKTTVVGDYGRFTASRETRTPSVRIDISTPDNVETGRQQVNTLLDSRKREMDGIESAREGFLFAPPTRVTLLEPDYILLPSTVDG